MFSLLWTLRDLSTNYTVWIYQCSVRPALFYDRRFHLTAYLPTFPHSYRALYMSISLFNLTD